MTSCLFRMSKSVLPVLYSYKKVIYTYDSLCQNFFQLQSRFFSLLCKIIVVYLISVFQRCKGPLCRITLTKRHFEASEYKYNPNDFTKEVFFNIQQKHFMSGVDKENINSMKLRTDSLSGTWMYCKYNWYGDQFIQNPLRRWLCSFLILMRN